MNSKFANYLISGDALWSVIAGGATTALGLLLVICSAILGS